MECLDAHKKIATQYLRDEEVAEKIEQINRTMPIRHAIWKVGDKPMPLSDASLGTEALLEKMIIEDSNILSERWMLDTDYNGPVFCASQVFISCTGAWDNLKRSFKAEFDDSVWEHLAGTESEPFALGEHKRIAVKVIDERGNELMAVREPDA